MGPRCCWLGVRPRGRVRGEACGSGGVSPAAHSASTTITSAWGPGSRGVAGKPGAGLGGWRHGPAPDRLPPSCAGRPGRVLHLKGQVCSSRISEAGPRVSGEPQQLGRRGLGGGSGMGRGPPTRRGSLLKAGAGRGSVEVPVAPQNSCEVSWLWSRCTENGGFGGI